MEKEIKKDFRSLEGILRKHKWERNVSYRGSIAGVQCIDIGGTISYLVERAAPVRFKNIDLDRHTFPSIDTKLIEKLEVSLMIGLSQAKIVAENVDPIQKLSVNFLIECKVKDVEYGYVASWHLDKHDGSAADFTHPLYHMNFGGNGMSKREKAEYGQLLLLATPRINHAPLDFFLAFDFVIRNFYESKKHLELTQDREYSQIIHRARNRYWKPYHFACASLFDSKFSISNLPCNIVFGD